MEEIPDEDCKALQPGLPEEVSSLLMTEEEYVGTLQRGEERTNIKETQKTEKIPSVERPHKESKVEYVKPDILECQPTSSKVKMEDLVTNDQERLMNQQTVDEETASTNQSTRSFWDRPVPRLQYDWPYDPRMPDEWNAVIASMRAHEGTRCKPNGDSYHQPLSEEVLKPENFTSYDQMENKTLDQLRRHASVYLNPGQEDADNDFKKLKARFNEPGHEKATRRMKEEQHTRRQKGKGKAEDHGLIEEDFPRLREQWYDEFEDILGGTKDELPPWREVNHEIHLIDDDKRYHYHLPRCPHSLRGELHDKINRYVNAGWWEPRSVNQAAPMLCIPKKDKHLRTVIDARQRNDNTIKDVTPLPDQDIIREDVAQGKIRSKIDLSDTYEQVRI